MRDFLVADAELPALGLTETWTDEELARCIVAAARKYNSIPPLIHRVSPAGLPADVNTFFEGAAVHAYTILMSKLQREDIDVVAGGVTSNMVQKGIAHCLQMIPMYTKNFEDAARAAKMTMNIRNCYGRL